MKNKLLLSPDMGRVPSLVLFPILPCFVNLRHQISSEELTESVVAISLGRTVVLYSSAHIFPPRRVRKRTQVLLTSLTFPTGANLSSDTYSISDLEFLDSLADLDDFTNNFVSGDYEGSYPWSPASCQGVVVLSVSRLSRFVLD